MTPADPFAMAARIAAHLENLNLRYVIGGSVAASIYGEPRSTLDLDVMIEADREGVRALVRQLVAEFYVEEEDAIQAVVHSGSFNAIHLESALKVDFFIAERDARTRGQMDRRRAIIAGGRTLWFYSREDIVVRKLVWFRLGGEQSDRQWRDVLGVLRMGGATIDGPSLRRAAHEFEVEDLLVQALEQAQRK